MERIFIFRLLVNIQVGQVQVFPFLKDLEN